MRPLSAGIHVCALAPQHLPGLLAVQQACYGAALIEGAEVFARRLASPANCSLVLEHAGQVVAYLAAYESVRHKVTPLQGDFAAVAAPAQPDTLYLHDMAVLPHCAGRGLAQALLAPLYARAATRGLQHAALVSVQGSHGYWARQGYAVQALAQATQRTRLASYGAGALYMARSLV
ncbi:MAG: GNAT family N-acetyltransferase [Simplicispira sp.]|nr:GNAT family N-acetyltransferase [Simplicispira sp.]